MKTEPAYDPPHPEKQGTLHTSDLSALILKRKASLYIQSDPICTTLLAPFDHLYSPRLLLYAEWKQHGEIMKPELHITSGRARDHFTMTPCSQVNQRRYALHKTNICSLCSSLYNSSIVMRSFCAHCILLESFLPSYLHLIIRVEFLSTRCSFWLLSISVNLRSLYRMNSDTWLCLNSLSVFLKTVNFKVPCGTFWWTKVTFSVTADGIKSTDHVFPVISAASLVDWFIREWMSEGQSYALQMLRRHRRCPATSQITSFTQCFCTANSFLLA